MYRDIKTDTPEKNDQTKQEMKLIAAFAALAVSFSNKRDFDENRTHNRLSYINI